ncbi:MAG: hypothetical protein A2664_03835 [Candidatus Taylorbacteria bacterium RIFCSPHIGHO2_01_FULL_46_22b]|uniref:Uncharacterized protein n=1 Tax=Candidatus Taylorbacteria bacterium RIFCSPHIGHO2_01_FULL_46_22b TaxID=1802301 RepID=A0A1G2M1H3_9BACT|nr:MAG: hypothetical protein A2664_03835 [Candidatus Taylorbacteria bacterium RIFCSPHIGHO2_01_FULL_46_22b]
MKRRRHNNFLLQDVGIIILSILVAILIEQTGALDQLIASTREFRFLGSFVAGLFFTSVFTTAPAMVVLGEMAHANGIWETAFFGAFGSLIGDLVIFRFIRDRLSEHLIELWREQHRFRRFTKLFKLRLFRWLTFLAGGLIIASPLPDELGVSLLGLSKARMSVFIPLSLVFNFIGLVLIGLVASKLLG